LSSVSNPYASSNPYAKKTPIANPYAKAPSATVANPYAKSSSSSSTTAVVSNPYVKKSLMTNNSTSAASSSARTPLKQQEQQKQQQQQKPSLHPGSGKELGMNSLWADRYAPSASSEILGNSDSVTKLTRWLSSWEKTFNNPKNAQKSNSGPNGPWKAALLSGPPGIGKRECVLSRLFGLCLHRCT
jgi:hypothetical protein